MMIAPTMIAVVTRRAAELLPAGRGGSRANEVFVGNLSALATGKVLYFQGKVLDKEDNAGYCKDVPYDKEVSRTQEAKKEKRTSGSPALTSGTLPRPRACNLGRAKK